MSSEIRVYIEGGGDERHTRANLRAGMGAFLSTLRERARACGVKWHIVACGSRNSAFEDFKNALKAHPGAFNVLLVDSEGPVTETPWRHLEKRDRWIPLGVSDDQCHLMVQAIEAWLIADVEALASFYGEGFYRRSIPDDLNVEAIDKTRLEDSLRAATRNTSKGEYHKTRHTPELLKKIDLVLVQKRAPHCKRLFDVLGRAIG